MRYLLALIVMAAAGAAGFLYYQHLTAGLQVNMAPPRHLQVLQDVKGGGTQLLPGGWATSSSLTLSAQDRKGVIAGVDVEVRRQGRHFIDKPTASIAPRVASSPAIQVANNDPAVHIHLPDGYYHWQIRLHSKDGLSPWVRYRGVIRVDTQPPSVPAISSTTDPHPGTTYHTSTMRFAWQTHDQESGIVGYSYRLDTDPHGTTRAEIRTATPAVNLAGLDTGTYYLHVRAVDGAGNWSTTATFPVRIDVTPPGLAHVRFSAFQFDPQFDSLQVSFGVTRPATKVHVGVYNQQNNTLVRLYTLDHLTLGHDASVTWDGKDGSGTPVPSGSYSVFIRAIDRYGHSSLTGWHDFIIDYRRIVVSLSQQKLWAYDGNRVLFTSLVTTGNHALPTPAGTYHIMAKFHPFTFHSPWPKSSPFYYAPSKVEYAMLFREGGYFIHDAPWRTAFGPGTNAQLGTPGTNYTGTHGCVNTPANIAQQLYNWSDIGTVVQVVP